MKTIITILLIISAITFMAASWNPLWAIVGIISGVWGCYLACTYDQD